jgi:hypothetical protein
MQLEDDEDRASISAMLKARERQEKEHQNYWRGPGGSQRMLSLISLEGDGEALASLRLQLEPSIRDGSAAFCRLILKAKLWMSSRSVSIA